MRRVIFAVALLTIPAIAVGAASVPDAVPACMERNVLSCDLGSQTVVLPELPPRQGLLSVSPQPPADTPNPPAFTPPAKVIAAPGASTVVVPEAQRSRTARPSTRASNSRAARTPRWTIISPRT